MCHFILSVIFVFWQFQDEKHVYSILKKWWGTGVPNERTTWQPDGLNCTENNYICTFLLIIWGFRWFAYTLVRYRKISCKLEFLIKNQQQSGVFSREAVHRKLFDGLLNQIDRVCTVSLCLHISDKRPRFYKFNENLYSNTYGNLVNDKRWQNCALYNWKKPIIILYNWAIELRENAIKLINLIY